MPITTSKLTRRGFLKLGLVSGATLSLVGVTLGVTSWVTNQTALGFSYLRSQDIAMLKAVLLGRPCAVLTTAWLKFNLQQVQKRFFQYIIRLIT